MKTAKQVIQRIKTIAVKEVGGVHFDREEVAQLRTLVDYVCRGFVGEEAREGLRTLKGKIYE